MYQTRISVKAQDTVSAAVRQLAAGPMSNDSSIAVLAHEFTLDSTAPWSYLPTWIILNRMLVLMKTNHEGILSHRLADGMYLCPSDMVRHDTLNRIVLLARPQCDAHSIERNI